MVPRHKLPLSVLVLACLLAAGCSRTRLGARAPTGVDGGQGSEAGSAPQDTSTDDVSSARSEVRNDVSPNGGDALSQPVDVRPACLPGPSEATSLGLLGDLINIYSLVPQQGRIFISAQAEPYEAPKGRIFEISLISRTLKSQDIDGVAPYAMDVHAGALFYSPGSLNLMSLGYRTTKVLRQDLATGETTELPNPVPDPLADLGLLTGNDGGDIIWTFGQSPQMQIAKWDPGSGKTTVLASSRTPITMLADASTLYWQEVTGDLLPRQLALFSMPLVGGAISTLLELPGATTWNFRCLLGADERELYYATDEQGPQLGVWAMPKQGGASRMVLPGRPPVRLDSGSIDDTHVYWVGWQAQETLSRTPKTGGPSETLWTAPLRVIQTVAVDACNVYWAVFNPAEVFYRAK